MHCNLREKVHSITTTNHAACFSARDIPHKDIQTFYMELQQIKEGRNEGAAAVLLLLLLMLGSLKS